MPEQRDVIFEGIKNLPSILASPKDFGLAISYLQFGETAPFAFIEQARDVILKNDVAWVQEMLSTCRNTDTIVIEEMLTTASKENNVEMSKILGLEVANNLVKDMGLEKMLTQLNIPTNSIHHALTDIIEKTINDMNADNLPSHDKAEIRAGLLRNLKTMTHDKSSDLGEKLQHRKHPKLDKLLSHIIHIEPKKFTDFKNKFNEIMKNNDVPDQVDETRNTGLGAG